MAKKSKKKVAGGGGKKKAQGKGKDAAPLTQHQQRQQREADRAMKKKMRSMAHRWDRARAECQQQFVRFNLQLRVLGLFVRDVAADGNCLFRALSDQLYQTQTKHSAVRAEICDHMLLHKDHFQWFVEDDVPFDCYLAKMRKASTWGGNLEIQAASMRYRVNITIHQLGEPLWNVTNWPADECKQIAISYHDGDHYASVRSMNERPGDAVSSGIADKAVDAKAASVQPGGAHGSISNSSSSASSSRSAKSSNLDMIMQVTGCEARSVVKEILNDLDNDVDEAIDYLCLLTPMLAGEEETDIAGVMAWYRELKAQKTGKAPPGGSALLSASTSSSESCARASSAETAATASPALTEASSDATAVDSADAQVSAAASAQSPSLPESAAASGDASPTTSVSSPPPPNKPKRPLSHKQRKRLEAQRRKEEADKRKAERYHRQAAKAEAAALSEPTPQPLIGSIHI